MTITKLHCSYLDNGLLTGEFPESYGSGYHVGVFSLDLLYRNETNIFERYIAQRLILITFLVIDIPQLDGHSLIK